MTVLRSGISAHTTVVTVDAPLSNPSYPLFYDIDSETIKVVDGADTTEWQVERGVADTQQARHAKSVQLVANANPYGGGGGGVSVVGPFAVAFDDFGGTGGNFPVGLTALPVGATVVLVWAETTVAWSGGGLTSAGLVIGIAPTADLTDSSDLVSALTNLRNTGGNTATYVTVPSGGLAFPARVIGPATLIAYLDSGLNGTPTAGIANVYALIATPAS